MAPLQRPPGDAVARLVEAQRLLARGQHQGVADLLQPALERAAVRPEANYLLAITHLLAGNAALAIEHARKSVAAQGGDARYHFTLGRACKAAGDLDGAETAYRQALAIDAHYADAMISLGIVLKTRGDADGAIELYDRALTKAPQSAAAHANRANALALRAVLTAEQTRDDPPSDAVIESMARAAALDADNPLVLRNHGVVLMRARRRSEAADQFNHALTLEPSHAETCLNLGACLRALGDNRLACELYEKWLGLNPPHAVVMRSLAALLTRVGQVDAAREWAEKAAALDLDAHALMQLGGTLAQMRRLEEAMEHCRRGIDMAGGRGDLYATMLLNASYLYEDPQPVFDLHAAFGRSLLKNNSLGAHKAQDAAGGPGEPAAPPSPRPPWRPLAPGERLKIGYVSGDFVRHSVSYFIGGLLERHDKARFDITCYNNLGWGDAVTERFKACGHRWVDCDGLSDDALRRRIQDDGIHILVDLAGHTANSRIFMFGLGVAPVQITYLGYPTVSGVPANDFRITDAAIDPDPSDLPAFASEQPLRLPRSMFCYRPDEHPPLAPPPALANGHITFGSFNNIAKVTDHTLDVWARVMTAVPGSRLLLKSASMAQPSNRENIERFMAARGVAAERLRLQPWIAGKSTHLEMYNELDIALDPFPYNGATTTCEALWMGVPVVTLRGRTHTSRMGASILASVGRIDCVTHNDAEYVAAAQRLAADLGALADWRAHAREHLASSELFDQAGFARHFEAALQQAWTLAGQRATTVQATTADIAITAADAGNAIAG